MPSPLFFSLPNNHHSNRLIKEISNIEKPTRSDIACVVRKFAVHRCHSPNTHARQHPRVQAHFTAHARILSRVNACLLQAPRVIYIFFQPVHLNRFSRTFYGSILFYKFWGGCRPDSILVYKQAKWLSTYMQGLYI